MAKQTVLQMTQDILASLDSDAVNSINDTIESQRVAQIIRNKYYDLMARQALPSQEILFQLVPSGSIARPCLMFAPTGTTRIDWIKYFDADTSNAVTPGYKYITLLSLEEFLDMINRFNPTDSNVATFTFTEGSFSFTLYYKVDRQPQYACVLENHYILFDSYNSDLDSTLQATKTMAFGNLVTPFLQVDGYTPDLDDSQFPLLLNEAKSVAFYELKQMPHMKADQEIKRQWSAFNKIRSIDNKPTYFQQLPDYGRVPRTGGFTSGGYGAYRWMRQSG